MSISDVNKDLGLKVKTKAKDLDLKAKTKAQGLESQGQGRETQGQGHDLGPKAKAKDSRYQYQIFYRFSCIVFLLLKCCGCFYVRKLFFVLTAFCPFMN